MVFKCRLVIVDILWEEVLGWLDFEIRDLLIVLICCIIKGFVEDINCCCVFK